MKKIIIKAPVNARYLSQIKDETGKDFELPNGILNKIIPNCGGTTLALESQHKTIICSPRIELLRNKHAQYPNSLLVIGGVTETEIRQYLQECKLPKVLTTYDSLSRLITIIDVITDWRVVVDEFQCILSDGAFKSEIELKLLESLTNFPYVTYLSATPIIDKYLQQIPQFKNLPYYEIEWSDTDKVYIQRQRHSNPINAALEIVNGFKNGIYPYIEDNQGNRVYSTECVIFLNSVQTIVNIVKATGLTPDDTNIIVGSSADNDKLIAKLGHGFERGRIPLKGEHHKLVTFCTSTAYAGCDFYSTNASTFVVSDCNRKNLAIDIATELVQIAGRQRLASNPFRNVITFIYRTNIGDYSETEFRTELTAKYESSIEEVIFKNNATGRIKEREIKNMKKIQAIEKYSESFAMWSDINQKFEINQIAYLNEQYCYEVQRMNYRNGITIKYLIEETNRFELLGDEEYYNRYSLQLKSLISRESFEEKMRNYIDARSNSKLRLDYTVECIEHKNPEIKYYYDQLGGATIKSLGYKECRIKAEINNRKIADRVPTELRKLLSNGEKVSNSFLKQTIQYVYDKLEMKKTAKSTDIKKYFPLSVGGQKLTDSTGHRVNGWIIQYS